MLFEYVEQPDFYNDTEISLELASVRNNHDEINDGEIYLTYIYVGY